MYIGGNFCLSILESVVHKLSYISRTNQIVTEISRTNQIVTEISRIIAKTCRRVNLIMIYVHFFDNMTYGYQ